MVAPRKPPTKWERTKKILWDSNINAPIRGAYNLMTTDDMERGLAGDQAAMDRAAGNSFDAAAAATAGGSMAPKPKGSITMGVGRPRGVKPSATPRVSIFSKNARAKVDATLAAAKAAKAKVGEIKDSGGGPAPAPSRTPGQTRLLNRLETQKAANAKSRAARDAGGGPSPASPKSNEKFGALVKRGDNLPAKQGPRDVVPFEKPSSSVVKYKPPSRSIATFGSKVGDKGAGGRLGSALKYGAVGAAVGGAGYGLYKGADKPKAEQASRGLTGGDSRMTPDARSPIGINRSKLTKDGKALFDKRQGQTAQSTVTAKAPGKATDKSRAAPKKMNAFEQMKQRQYEKEGHGGRSLTASGAKAQVLKERAYKFKDLFGKKK